MAAADGAAALIRVEVAFSPAARQVLQVQLEMPSGSHVREALDLSGLLPSSASVEGLSITVWGKPYELGDLLRDGDRVEICRPLLVDPKEARRLRHQKQRATPKRR